MPAWFAWAVLIREVLVAVATLVLAAMGARRIEVTWYGKAGTFANMFAFPLFLGSHSTVSYAGLCGFARVVLRHSRPGPQLVRGLAVHPDRSGRVAGRPSGSSADAGVASV